MVLDEVYRTPTEDIETWLIFFYVVASLTVRRVHVVQFVSRVDCEIWSRRPAGRPWRFPSGRQNFFPPCAQSPPDVLPFERTRAPHGFRANRGRTREASSAVRTKLSAWRPLFRNGCETGSWAILGRRSKRMPNSAAARGRPAANRSLYLCKSTSD